MASMCSCDMKGILFLLLLLIIDIGTPGAPLTVDNSWTPQHGTPTFPKTVDFNVKAKQGDIFQIKGKYYQAKHSFYLHRSPLDDRPQDGSSNLFWSSLVPGNLVLPKVFGRDQSATSGDIFLDTESGRYYRAMYSVDSIRQDPAADARQWDPVDVNGNWMTLLAPVINDKRLSDLVIPGSHDSGTWGITKDSVIVDYGFQFGAGHIAPKEAMVNWSVTHHTDLDQQLRLGFREFDLRIADMQPVENAFRWWHAFSGDEISPGLDQVAEFAESHPREVIIIDFQHFAAVGNETNPKRLIPDSRKDELSDLILGKLGSRMAPKGGLGYNPTVGELLATGGNILAIMKDEYIQAKDDRYWPVILQSNWTLASNPEQLFLARSRTLKDNKANFPDRLTDISGCTTPSERTLAASMVRAYGSQDPRIQDAVKALLGVSAHDVIPDDMSFEGLYTNLVTMAAQGTNTAGMMARPPSRYSHGGSVHYMGVNQMVHHWLARPQLYKVNILYADDLPSSTLVAMAIEANRGAIPREVTITNQGSPLDGRLTWQSNNATGGSDGLICESIVVRVTVNHGSGQEPMRQNLSRWESITFTEGQYPPETRLYLEYTSHGSPEWTRGDESDIQTMIENNLDMYIRGSSIGGGQGFAYSSYEYDIFAESCSSLPAPGNVNLVQWGEVSAASSSTMSVYNWPLTSAFVALALLLCQQQR